MNEQDRQLLFKELCARLPYELHFKMEVDGKSTNKILTPEWINDIKYHPQHFKPYLRPMSSMTEEEKNEIKALGAEFSPIGSIRFRIEEDENDGFEYGYQWLDILDFLNKHHFDYRGLIEKGLALEAPEGMYNF